MNYQQRLQEAKSVEERKQIVREAYVQALKEMDADWERQDKWLVPAICITVGLGVFIFLAALGT